MIFIYLCDDNEIVRKSYKDLIESIATEIKENISIREFNSGDSLLFALQECPSIADIIYLDIIMPGIDGMTTARKLRSYGCNSELIFLTSEKNYVFESFDASPTYYIVKSAFNPIQFKKILIRTIENAKYKKREFFTCKNGAAIKRIAMADIFYFDITNRIVTVHYKDGTFDFYSNMGQLEEALKEKPFVRIHRSILVNLQAIESITSKSLHTFSGDELPIGRTYYSEVQASLSDFLNSTF